MKNKKPKRIPAILLTIPKKPFPRELLVNSQILKEDNSEEIKSIDKEPLSKKDIRNMADLATNLWRAKQRLVGLIDKGNFPAEAKKVLRPIESAIENLEVIGIRIEEFTGQPYVQGMALNVISSQPNSTLKSDIIYETLKPTIFFRDQFIQAGDVIIEGPPSAISS